MYVLRSKDSYRFLSTISSFSHQPRYSEEYPDAKNFKSLKTVRDLRNRLNASGYNLEIIQDYGLATEKVIE